MTRVGPYHHTHKHSRDVAAALIIKFAVFDQHILRIMENKRHLVYTYNSAALKTSCNLRTNRFKVQNFRFAHKVYLGAWHCSQNKRQLYRHTILIGFTN
jgi:hypothetical protein